MSTTTTTTLRLTTDERAALDVAADACGLGPCSYARRAVMLSVGRDVKVRRRPDGLAQAVTRLLGEAGRIGNNVNQLARVGNRGLPVPADALEGCRLDLTRLTAAVQALQEPRR